MRATCVDATWTRLKVKRANEKKKEKKNMTLNNRRNCKNARVLYDLLPKFQFRRRYFQCALNVKKRKKNEHFAKQKANKVKQRKRKSCWKFTKSRSIDFMKYYHSKSNDHFIFIRCVCCDANNESKSFVKKLNECFREEVYYLD